jgi:phage shock protein C
LALIQLESHDGLSSFSLQPFCADCVDLNELTERRGTLSTQYRQLYRSRQNRWIGGVCGGLGMYFGIDPTLVRVLFVLGIFVATPFAMLLAYLILLIVVPNEPGFDSAP